MSGIVKNLHVILFLYFGYEVFQSFEKLESLQKSKTKKIGIIEKKIKTLRKKKKELDNYFISIEEAKQNIETVALEVEKTQRQLPSDISPTENLGLIKELAEKMNLKDVLLKPLADINKGFYIVSGYQLEGKGTYLQFLIFFEKIAENKRLLNISDLTLKRLKKNQRGRFQLIGAKVKIEAFQYNKGYKEDRGLKDIERKIKESKIKKIQEKKSKKTKKKKRGRSKK